MKNRREIIVLSVLFLVLAVLLPWSISRQMHVHTISRGSLNRAVPTPPETVAECAEMLGGFALVGQSFVFECDGAIWSLPLPESDAGAVP